jgi:hypothetical protein
MRRLRTGLRAILAAMAITFPVVGWSMPTSAELASADEAERRGAEMFAYDQAAWHATDRFQEDIRRSGASVEALMAQGLG